MGLWNLKSPCKLPPCILFGGWVVIQPQMQDEHHEATPQIGPDREHTLLHDTRGSSQLTTDPPLANTKSHAVVKGTRGDSAGGSQTECN